MGTLPRGAMKMATRKTAAPATVSSEPAERPKRKTSAGKATEKLFEKSCLTTIGLGGLSIAPNTLRVEVGNPRRPLSCQARTARQ